MRLSALALLAALSLSAVACDEPPVPTAPTAPSVAVNVTVTQTQGGTATPGASPSPTAPGAGLTPTSAKVTIIGNSSGSKVVAPGASVPLTFTRFARNATGNTVEVPGNPTDAVTWRVFNAEDRGSPTISDPSCGRCVQNYNRDIRVTGAVNTSLSVTASQGDLEATIVLDVR